MQLGELLGKIVKFLLNSVELSKDFLIVDVALSVMIVQHLFSSHTINLLVYVLGIELIHRNLKSLRNLVDNRRRRIYITRFVVINSDSGFSNFICKFLLGHVSKDTIKLDSFSEYAFTH